jgi:uncharacterized protein (TIGR00369 family)
MSEVVRTPTTKGHLEALARLAASKEGAPPVARLIGFDLESIELGRSVFSFQASEKHANPMGTLHGGVICDVADAALGTAIATTLEDDESFTTLSLTAEYFKPVWTQKLRVTARVTRRTRQIGFIECDVEDEKGSIVAKVQSICMVLRGEEAKGR